MELVEQMYYDRQDNFFVLFPIVESLHFFWD